MSDAPDALDLEFRSAIDRILNRHPRHADLLQKIKEGKELRLNPVNIAKEAGRSRSALYERKEVMEYLKTIVTAPRNELKAQIVSLKEANRRLTEERQRALNTAAAVIIRMRKLEEKLPNAARRAKREAERPNQNEVAGTVVPFAPPGKEA
ncbi:hypothetical protein [Antarcticirhabdus aurantiaca]|uniref:Uncharacterized protein n=1 Tax=Antarcticirhabdus aurantiaca TaxID=2606717 RepID=A0ACD4NIL6_9HYPH|nr:hypothetical protein [Antarcticirhabdus aurantiaca]WAJ26668.1 hypothetical protein OXU80_17570 [Jeongeuplla avenae]